jgi:hypothetical protein
MAIDGEITWRKPISLKVREAEHGFAERVGSSLARKIAKNESKFEATKKDRYTKWAERETRWKSAFDGWAKRLKDKMTPAEYRLFFLSSAPVPSHIKMTAQNPKNSRLSEWDVVLTFPSGETIPFTLPDPDLVPATVRGLAIRHNMSSVSSGAQGVTVKDLWKPLVKHMYLKADLREKLLGTPGWRVPPAPSAESPAGQDGTGTPSPRR